MDSPVKIYLIFVLDLYNLSYMHASFPPHFILAEIYRTIFRGEENCEVPVHAVGSYFLRPNSFHNSFQTHLTYLLRYA
jgi:hypothetical protein